MFAYRVICRQSPEHIDVKDFKLLKYSQVAELVDAGMKIAFAGICRPELELSYFQLQVRILP